jgi:hypothetical protein
VSGSNRSTDAPATKTLPFASKVAVRLGHDRTAVISPVAVKVPVEGSYNSALARLLPPAIRTFPLFRSVAVCPDLGIVMSPVAAKAPVEES